MPIRKSLPSIEVTFFNPQNDKKIQARALVDTGANVTVIPESFVSELGLQTHEVVQMQSLGMSFACKQYLCGIQIGRYQLKRIVIGINNVQFPLLGWDLVAEEPVSRLLVDRIFGSVINLLDAIPSFKKNAVLILGQDTTEMYRLETIRKLLSPRGYTGIIPKTIADIEIQSVEEKINMLASLCRFVICENSFPSGHIDELKICSLNRFVTAILQEEGKGATWMQSDYPLDFAFMKTITYSEMKDIDSALDAAIEWAENKVNDRRAFFNKLYKWRGSN